MANTLSHHGTSPENSPVNRNEKRLTIALAGNANVGKSVIFNQLTGSHQTIGNWPGKTVESAKGFLDFHSYNITIVDLPGIYSLSTFSLEEIVTRDFIAQEKPDVIINVIGAPVLERNLFFTLQLLEMDMPMIVCLNQVDLAESKGIKIDVARLESRLGIPVIPTVASRGQGITELINKAIEITHSPETQESHTIKSEKIPATDTNLNNSHNGRHGHQRRHRLGARFRSDIDTGLTALTTLVESENLNLDYPSHWVAIKLLEGDTGITDLVRSKSAKVITASEALAKQTEEAYRQPRFAAVASERYALANEIASAVQTQTISRQTFIERLDRLTTQRVFGYVTSIIVIAGLLLWTFSVGNAFSKLLSDALSFFQPIDPQISGSFWSILWNGLFGGFVAGVTLVLPFVIPFYLLLAIMEDSGILTRVAFMLDSTMHQMGLHGKAIIPLILGYGCSVPAIAATRIMGTRRERLLASFAITFAPCTARTIVVLGLVATFVNIWWALALYAIDLIVMFIAVKVAMKIIPW